MANVYTRNKREVLQQIWRQIRSHYVDDTIEYRPGRHPETLVGGHTQIPIPPHWAKPSPVKPRTILRTGRAPSTEARLAPVVLADTPWETRLTQFYLITPTENYSLHTHWVHKDAHTTNQPGIGRTVDPCNFRYPHHEFELVQNQAQHNSRVARMKPCTTCFLKLKVPEG